MNIINCRKESCLSFNVEVFRHVFKTGEPHAKALCNNCGYAWFISRDYLEIDTPIYSKQLFQKKRKEIRRQKSSRPASLKVENITAKIEEPKQFKSCIVCENRFLVRNRCNRHTKGICSKRCQKRSTRKAKENKSRIYKIGPGFYTSRPWLELRYKVLKKYGRKCLLCGVLAKEVHVDHIRPISKYPEQALDFNNLQVLCKDCNVGKSNKDETDFRPKQ